MPVCSLNLSHFRTEIDKGQIVCTRASPVCLLEYSYRILKLLKMLLERVLMAAWNDGLEGTFACLLD